MRIEKTTRNMFSRHTVDINQVAKMSGIREHATVLAQMILGLCPESREKSHAMERLEECVMWANKSIALLGEEIDDVEDACSSRGSAS